MIGLSTRQYLQERQRCYIYWSASSIAHTIATSVEYTMIGDHTACLPCGSNEEFFPATTSRKPFERDGTGMKSAFTAPLIKALIAAVSLFQGTTYRARIIFQGVSQDPSLVRKWAELYASCTRRSLDRWYCSKMDSIAMLSSDGPDQRQSRRCKLFTRAAALSTPQLPPCAPIGDN